MTIDCERCGVRGRACADCVVTFLARPPRGTEVDLDQAERDAIDVLAHGGLVRPLRLRAI